MRDTVYFIMVIMMTNIKTSLSSPPKTT